jgi:Flp pilus assembly protein TadG
MKRTIPGSHQRGVAAIELAILLPILIIGLAWLVLLAQYMWHYTVVHRAAQDAARFLSTVPRAEMSSRVLAGRVRDVASEIVRRELSDLAPEDELLDPEVECDTDDCGFTTGAPQTVRVKVSFDFYDRIFQTYLGPRGLTITANVTMNYVGR